MPLAFIHELLVTKAELPVQIMNNLPLTKQCSMGVRTRLPIQPSLLLLAAKHLRQDSMYQYSVVQKRLRTTGV